MNRREFITRAGATGAALSLPRAAFAQQKVPRIAYLAVPQNPDWYTAFEMGLTDFGYTVGKTIVVDKYIADISGLPAAAAMAVSSKPDLIVSIGSPASLAAKAATVMIPIVASLIFDPPSIGLVSSFAHPGGNITGNSNGGPDLIGKQIGVLREAFPAAKRIAVLTVPADPTGPLLRTEADSAARTLGLDPVFVEFADSGDFAGQFQPVVDAAPDVVFQTPNNYLSTNLDKLFDLYVKYKLLAVSGSVSPGATIPFSGMVAYGVSSSGTIRESGSFVESILKGAKPADLPFELPTIFDLGVNTDMAKKIGVTIPISILAQATVVIDYDIRAPH